MVRLVWVSEVGFLFLLLPSKCAIHVPVDIALWPLGPEYWPDILTAPPVVSCPCVPWYKGWTEVYRMDRSVQVSVLQFGWTFRTPMVHEQSIQEMLRKARQQQQHNRKAKQHNTTRPKQSFFKEKLAASGGTRTHDHQLARRCSYQLSYRGSSAGWAESCIQILKHLNLINR